MPWYFQWPEGIKKRACRYLLQRYLGQYLKEKLTLDQLSVDLYNGTGTINELNLDVEALNEMCQTFNLPIEFVDGYVDRISVSIPWSSLLSESCFVEVHRLMMTLRPKQRSDQSGLYAASMFGSMWGSMTTSMQLAQECLRESDKDVENAGTMDGLELFAQTIESVLCRIKVRFVDTTLRLENIPRGSKTGMALEIRIKKMDYFDEAGGEDLDKRDVNQPAAFTCKKFLWEGVNLYTDEFLCDSRRCGRYSSVGSSPESKMCESAFMTAPVTPDIMTDAVEFDGNGNTQEPIFFARLSGRQEIRLKVKQWENIEGVKVAAEFILGSVIAFASPRQVHLLIELCNGLLTPSACSQMHRCAVVTNKQMQASDFEKVERELQRQLASGIPSGGLLQQQGWSSQTLDDSDDEFLPMGLNRTMASSVSSDIGSQKSFSPSSSASSFQAPSFMSGRPRLKAKSDCSAAEESATFKVQLSALAIVVLHEEVLTVGADGSGVLTQASLSQMRSMAESFFNKVGDFSPSGYGAKGLFAASERLTAACRQNHLRVVAAPVTMDGNEKTLSGQRMITACLTFGIAELVECLVEKEHIVYIKILHFPEDVIPSGSGNFYVPQPCLRLKVAHSLGSSCTQGRRSRNVTRPKTEISANLASFASEVDISIVDRIHSLLRPHLAANRDNGRCGPNDSYFLLNQRLIDNNSKLLGDALDTEDDVPDDGRSFAGSGNSRIDVTVTSPNATISVRFPVPDLRPAYTLDRLPWWHRSVRDDVLTLRLTEAVMRVSGDGPEVLDVRCRQFTGSLKESDKSEDVKFLWADADGASKDGFNWPRFTLQIYPLQPSFILEDPVNMSDSFNGNSIDTLLHHMCTAGTAEPSPFSSRKVVYGSDAEAEQMIVPCDGPEMTEFMDRILPNCRCVMKLDVPALRIVLPNKHFYEVLYNRINTDLLLWEPSAPKPPSAVVGTDPQWRETFSVCKSALQYDSGSDSEEGALSDGDCSTLGPTSSAKSRGQSKLALVLNVSRGSLSCRYPDVTTSQGFGELWLQTEDATLFVVNSFLGRSTEDTICVQANKASLHYSGFGAGGGVMATVYQSEAGTVTRMSGLVGTGGDSLNMLSVAVRMTLDPTVHRKTIRVALGLRGATLRHRICTSSESWYSQLLGFFDVLDYPVAGYNPPAIVTELHLHTWGCAVDYRPLYLPLRAMVTLETLSVCSNITAQTPTTVLRFIAEDAYLFVSDNLKAGSVDLKNDYVCVVDFGFFELSLRMTESKDLPRFELSASNNMIHIRTCSDSCRALQDLLTYFANDGDLKVERTEDDDYISSHGSAGNLPSLQEMEQVHDLMEEAMQESSTSVEPHDTGARVPLDGSGSISQEPAQVFLFPDEEGGRRSEEVTVLADDEFCILENDLGVGIVPRTGEPQVRLLDPGNNIKIIENYFAPPLGRTDQLKAPKHFPMPIARYTLQDMSLIWHVYGGSDFSPVIPGTQKRTWINPNKKSGSSPDMDIGFRAGTDEVRWPSSTSPSSMSPPSSSSLSWQSRGGPGRQHNVLMELQMNKVRFRHEVYPDGLEHAARQVLLVHEVEVRDRLADSQINKFLYQYSSEAMPRPSCANMLVIKATHVRPDPSLPAQECSLKVSMLPLRLNIDQDALFFLCTFFGQLSPSKPEGSITTDNKSQQGSSHQAPVMCVNTNSPCSILLLEDDDSESDDGSGLGDRSTSTSDGVGDCQASSPVFFRSFVFSPDVPIRLDYHGKRVDMEQGALAGLIIGLGQLNCSELRLKRLRYRQGLLGFDRLLAYAIGEWLKDIRKYQLPSLLGGVGPMYSLVQLVQGIRDLFWMPIEQYRKDGRIVRGLQRGANAFTTSTAMAALELTTRLVHAIQSTAETAYDMVSPGPSVRQQRLAGTRVLRKCHSQPVDIREGVANAYQVVREGLGDTARNLVQVASEEHEHKGISGAVGGVLRQIPSTVVKPIIVATEATSNVLGGVRHQLAPDTRREAAEKWRTDN